MNQFTMDLSIGQKKSPVSVWSDSKSKTEAGGGVS